MSKVGIVTLPLHFNYGGILQAYALQQTVSSLGYDAVIIGHPKNTFKEKIKWQLYKFSRVYRFVNANIRFFRLQDPFIGKIMENHHLLALIVGSDQVWRPCMGVNRNRNVDRYFLKSDGKFPVKKIAYAASFGVDYWDFTYEETVKAKALIKDFKSVSVRESSGLSLCEKHLGCKEVLQVLDPTMLLKKSDYEKFISINPFITCKKHCFAYLLDYVCDDNQKIVEQLIGKDTELIRSKVERNPVKKYLNSGSSVEEWLSFIYFSDVVITDSFHGCVFSILFHKEFYVMGNAIGGNARISSLLNMFNLQNRFIERNQVCIDNTPINWTEVEDILNIQRKKSMSYLKINLS